MKEVTYEGDFLKSPFEDFIALTNELEWIRVDGTPRMEYYCNEFNVPYTYGRGAGIRTYGAMPWNKTLLRIKSEVESKLGIKFEAAFLNRYMNSKDHLGWHADDSPEVDENRPIAIISLGAEREIWFKPIEDVTVHKLSLASGSLCLMAPGMQKTHYHRIPKASYDAGPRISITLRGFVNK